jgi:hypothetical protein
MPKKLSIIINYNNLEGLNCRELIIKHGMSSKILSLMVVQPDGSAMLFGNSKDKINIKLWNQLEEFIMQMNSCTVVSGEYLLF